MPICIDQKCRENFQFLKFDNVQYIESCENLSLLLPQILNTNRENNDELLKKAKVLFENLINKINKVEDPGRIIDAIDEIVARIEPSFCFDICLKLDSTYRMRYIQKNTVTGQQLIPNECLCNRQAGLKILIYKY